MKSVLFTVVTLMVILTAALASGQNEEAEAVDSIRQNLIEFQKFLERDYESRLEDLNRKFAGYSDQLAIKLREIDQLQKEIRSELGSISDELASDTKRLRTETDQLRMEIKETLAAATQDLMDDTTKLQKRADQIQNNIQTQLNSVSQDLANNIGRIQNDVGKVQTNIQKKLNEFNQNLANHKHEIRKEVEWVGTLLKILLAFSILGIISLFVSVFKYARTKANELFESRFHVEFDRQFEKKKTSIREIIDEKDKEAQLKKDKSIMVMSDVDQENSFAYNLLERLDFKNISHKTFHEDVDFSNINVVLIDDDRNLLDQTEIIDKASKTPPESIYFYFGPKRITVEDSELQTRIAFANVKFQLYGNLFSALQYQESLEARTTGSPN